MQQHKRLRSAIHRLAIPLVLAGLAAATVSAATWHVATDGSDGADGTTWATAVATIGNAVAKASPAGGDTVLVSNGIYLVTEEIAVTTSTVVRTVNGRDFTVVARDPASTNRLLNLRGGATVSGFTISNGFLFASNSLAYTSALWGAGVYMTDATLSDCVVTACLIVQVHSNVLGGGGGIYVGHANALVVDCLVSNNGVVAITTNNTGRGSNKMGGGGIFLDRGTVLRCAIVTNAFTYSGTMGAHSGGGGVDVYGSGGWAYLRSSTITENNWSGAAGWEGGGGVRLGNGAVEDCLISRNSSFRRGGGVYLCAGEGAGGSTAAIRRCRIIGNRCAGGQNYAGSGIHVAQANAPTVIENSLIIDGIGLYEVNPEGGTASFRNCTVAGTGVTYSVYRYGVPTNTFTFVNCIVTGPITNRSLATPWLVFTNCCAPSSNAVVFPAGTNGNIAKAPLFFNAAAGDYHLDLRSPCVNAGLNQSWMTNAVDLDGNARLMFDNVDIGCYEMQRRVLGGVLLQVW